MDDWASFMKNEPMACAVQSERAPIPVPSEIYISTKTYISYLDDRQIGLAALFWNLEVIPYNARTTGIIKKQMKFSSTTREEVADVEARLSKYDYSQTQVMLHVDSADKYKDVRKVTVGISKKDMLTFRVKAKGAFYNCFVLIVRVLADDQFKEFHVKVFNTGKIEIPGIQDDAHLPLVVQVLVDNIRRVQPISYIDGSEEIVLINSNFNCRYFINREKLFAKLRYTYGVAAVYDPCSYPGIQCKLYSTPEIATVPAEDAYVVSVMIFRTGSVLIVGKCTVDIIDRVYEYLNQIFRAEYQEIMDPNCMQLPKKESKSKGFRKSIMMN
jgi:hypothetical protein